MKKIKLSALTEYITNHLDISDRFLCSLIGITPASLSNQKDVLLETITKNKVGRRVTQLFVVVHHFALQGMSKEVTIDCIRMPAFQDLKDNYDSVSTAIQQDKYEVEVLVEISKMAYQEYQRKQLANDELFPAVKDLLAEAI